MKYPNLVIGGTNKAGTTSVFHYLSDHPEVCGSKVKEMAYYLSDTENKQELMSKCFSHHTSEKYCLEATTSYLALANDVIPNIKNKDVQILFILRNPIERIYSYFHFHKGHLAIPQNMTFEEYWDICLSSIPEADLPFDSWHLKAPKFGLYADMVQLYIQELTNEKVKVLFFDDLKEDPCSFMAEVSRFIGVDESFYVEYQFSKTNQTFSSKNRSLHKIAIWCNRSLGIFLRQRPNLKRKLVGFYKAINMARHGYPEISSDMKEKLESYYAESNRKLESLCNRKLPKGW